MKLITFVCAAFLCLPSLAQEKFPDGTPVSDWFKDSKIIDINTLGKKYILTDYGVINDSTLLQTEKIQSAIDAAAQNGGGVIVIPKGTYLSGALFFKPQTHLHLEEGAVLKGSDDISNFPIIDTAHCHNFKLDRFFEIQGVGFIPQRIFVLCNNKNSDTI